MAREISEEHILRYLSLTKKAIKKVKQGNPGFFDRKMIYDDFLDMAKRYLSDAEHFFTKGDWVNALSAVNYAHGWLDAGARIGVFDVKGDNKLFAVDGKSPGQTKKKPKN